ncbi:uracil-DNA glycosylase [Clostridium sp. CAG:628]|jgi:uracil-DNA glycosylase|nr:uracil-DNA glycosylase [Clostridium sp. CAG:628]
MINNDWDEVLSSVWNSPGYKKFMSIIDKKYSETTCFPEYNDIFNALKLTPYSKVKVVILGQDPYHGTGEAHGLSFSVKDDIKKPPSLKNIFKELHDDLGYPEPKSGNLEKWAKEGVLLLNSVLTVEKDKAASHKDLGWEILTDHIIKLLNMKETPIVFILWGNFAKKKKVYITNKKHLIIESPHPSPFSAYTGFFGSKPFSKTNNFLIKNNIEPIDFNLNK